MDDLARDAPAERNESRDDRNYSPIDAPIWYPATDVLSPQMRNALTRTIESEIIPRLLLLSRTEQVAVMVRGRPTKRRKWRSPTRTLRRSATLSYASPCRPLENTSKAC